MSRAIIIFLTVPGIIFLIAIGINALWLIPVIQNQSFAIAWIVLAVWASVGLIINWILMLFAFFKYPPTENRIAWGFLLFFMNIIAALIYAYSVYWKQRFPSA